MQLRLKLNENLQHQKFDLKLLRFFKISFFSCLFFSCLGCKSFIQDFGEERSPGSIDQTYFVDRQGGDDANHGKTPNSAWKTLQKVNSSRLLPGDKILFRRGQVWDESLRVSSSGTSSLPITFGAYGEGPRPIFTGAIDVRSKSWIQVRSGVWSVALPADEGRRPERIFIGGKPLEDRFAKTSVAELSFDQEWSWDNANGGTLYFFSRVSPAQFTFPFEVNVRRRGIMLGMNNFIHIKEIQLMRFREGLWIGGNNCVIEDFTSNENSFSGVTIIGSSNRLKNFETSDNGVDLRPGGTQAHGLGVLLDGFESLKASNNEVSDFVANDNSEDGVQTGPLAGNGNRFNNAQMKGNRENCFDIKSGDQFIIGGEVKSDAEKSADCILVHKVPHKLIIQNIRASATTKGPALHVREGAVVEARNIWLQSEESSAILIGKSAGDGTKILNSEIVDGGKKSKFLIDVQSGNHHVFHGNTFHLPPGVEVLRTSPAASLSFENNRLIQQ